MSVDYNALRHPEGPPRPEGVEYRRVWRTGDAAAERDAAAFWRDNGLLGSPERLDERLGELNVCAYVDGRLAGVSTARLRDTPFLRTRLAMHRCSVGPGYRRLYLANWLTVEAILALEDWSRANPEEGVTGVGAVIQATIANANEALWRTGLNLVGYTEEGEQFRVAWFPHAKLF